MKCIKCGCEKLKTIDSRPSIENTTRRRKKCENCGFLFTTYESVTFEKTSPGTIYVTYNDGTISRFSDVRLVRSITAYNKDFEMEAAEIAMNIKIELLENSVSTINVDDLISMVSKQIKDVNYNAYVRYACKYTKFIPEVNKNEQQEN